MYFEKFPKILYDFQNGNTIEYKLVTDVTRNVRVIKDLLANVTLYDEYDIKDGETAEIIADKFYGSPNYHWIVMLTNERYDYASDFPLSTFELEKHITEKYGFTTLEIDSTDNALISLSTNTFFVEHPFQTGDRVIYSNDSGTSIGGLVNGRTYYVIQVNDLQFRVASSRTNATNGIEVNLTSFGTSVHTFSLNNQYNVHHYEDSNGKTVPEVYTNIYGITEPTYPVSNYEYEERLNESKRRIKIISPQVLATILKNFEDII